MEAKVKKGITMKSYKNFPSHFTAFTERERESSEMIIDVCHYSAWNFFSHEWRRSYTLNNISQWIPLRSRLKSAKLRFLIYNFIDFFSCAHMCKNQELKIFLKKFLKCFFKIFPIPCIDESLRAVKIITTCGIAIECIRLVCTRWFSRSHIFPFMREIYAKYNRLKHLISFCMSIIYLNLFTDECTNLCWLVINTSQLWEIFTRNIQQWREKKIYN